MLAEHGVALPSVMAELVERLVAADPDDRPTTPQAVAAELEKFTDAGAVQAALARDDAGRAAEPGQRDRGAASCLMPSRPTGRPASGHNVVAQRLSVPVRSRRSP